MKFLLLLAILSTSSSLLAEDVSISVDGKKLHGDLEKSQKESSQAVFILSGSGPTDRDGNTIGAPGKNNSLKYLAESLGKGGFTTLRVDKRGIGASSDSGVKEADLRFSTYVEDAKQWIKFLEGQGYSKIVLVGHSEGALVATLAASSDSVTALVCIAGAGRPAADILREQLKPQLPPDLYLQTDKILLSLTEGKTAENPPPSLNALFRPSVQPYLISWFQLDPAKSLSEIKVPVLIIQGSTDLQTSTKDANLLHAAAKGSKLLIIEGMNHVLKEIKGDLMAQTPSYLSPDIPIHKELGTGILDFLKANP